ncbi:MAG: hypothetical protein KGV57_01365 [Fusobacterium sp.]|nr:hypothetical protein [Fusobacterium sp.]
MYKYNGYEFGYFVQRNSWSDTVAKIINIDGVLEGEPIKGQSPYFENQKVIAEFYDSEGNFKNIDELSCPGTYGYDLIKPLSIKIKKDDM